MASETSSRSKSFNMKRVALMVVILGVAGGGTAWWMNRKPMDESTSSESRPKADPAVVKASAEKGDAAAQNALGEMNSDGSMGKVDYAEAAKWFRKSADQGFAKGQFNLATLYGAGQGVPQNDEEAAQWYRKAADAGYTDAQYTLGGLYSTGRGVPLNPAEAIKWHTKAAEGGEPLAMYNLAERYERGSTVTQDFVEALKWHTVAAERGLADAAKSRDNLSKKMTGDQITEAKKRAAEFDTKFPIAKSKRG